MISKSRLFFLLCVVSMAVNALQLPKKLQKKVDKEIRSAFEIEKYSLKPVEVSKELGAQLVTKITKNNLSKIIKNDTIIGYMFIDKAPSKTDEFDYLVLFDDKLIIRKSKVLIYREEYGGEISSKRWLRQFENKTSTDRLNYEKDIIAISGATISAKSMTVAINNLLKTINILQKRNAI